MNNISEVKTFKDNAIEAVSELYGIPKKSLSLGWYRNNVALGSKIHGDPTIEVCICKSGLFRIAYPTRFYVTFTTIQGNGIINIESRS
jgi:hypothetical protein